MSLPSFGAKENANIGCLVAGSENIGSFMGNEEVKITSSKSKLHVHSNKNCELDLESSGQSTILACVALKIENPFGQFDIRETVKCSITGKGVSAVIEGSKDVYITDTFFSSVYVIDSNQVEIGCEGSRVMVFDCSQVSVEGDFMICRLQDVEDSSFVANDDGRIIANQARRINVKANKGRYVTISGVDDFNVTPAKDDRSSMHIVPSPDDSNEHPLFVDVKYSRMCEIGPTELTIGMFKLWKQKEDGDAAKKDNIFGLHFETENFDINGFKVIEVTESRVTFEGNIRDQKEFLEIGGNIIGLSEDRRILYISTNVAK